MAPPPSPGKGPRRPLLIRLLAFHDHRLERSHDVERLVELAETYEPAFVRWEDAAITLGNWAPP
ncbi:MAG: hypothetical protein ACLQVX_16175 [Limisphaerales bacterium]